MPRALRQYAVLAVLFVGAFYVQAGNTAFLLRLLRHGADVPAYPVALIDATRTVAGGPYAGNQILAVDGHTLISRNQLLDAVRFRHPGETILLTMSQPDGRAIERAIPIPNQEMDFEALSDLSVTLALNVVIPIVSLILGFAVAAIRPRDWRAWIVLFLMLGFTESVRTAWFFGPVPIMPIVWGAFWRIIFPVALMYFGIYFPSRSARDKRIPWFKYIFVVLFGGIYFADEGILLIWRYSISFAESFHPIFPTLQNLRTAALLLANVGFFVNMRRKRDAETSPDARRRLSILRAGCWIAVGPFVVLAFLAVIRGLPLFAGVPVSITVPTLLLLTLFPLTLFYVIVVEHAMDLRFVIRTGVKYALARTGLWVIRSASIAVLVYLIVNLERSGSNVYLKLFGAVMVLLVVRQRSADKASQWVDRKFFREAYNAEQVLAELATEVGRYLEAKPLLQSVAPRLAETLHVSDIVILLREGDTFRTTYTTRSGEPMEIAVSSHIVRHLQESREPVPIYFDSPPDWLRQLTTIELQTLDFMRTRLLLPLSGREQMAGIMSLGAKRSEVPYSQTDIRLLQAVAWQMGMALENSRLMASLADAAVMRERVVRELEIAREVQERLFPQKFPQLPGFSSAGYCRPALGVGGDYFDFVQLPKDRVGIAVGDVSGKGIAAALLMASLQASLRSQAVAGVASLAELMTNVNRLIYEASTSSRYATLFYGEYHADSRELRYVNAGHNPPFIFRTATHGDTQEIVRLEAGGTVVGLLPVAAYEAGSVTLRPGDILVAFTDGISEALNEADEEWGEDRFFAAARKAAGLDPARLIQSIFVAADEFTGSARQSDDMTLVVIKLS